MDAPSFSFRPVTQADKDAVMALCAKIWEGDDYITDCFDEWTAAGGFTACEHSGRLIGLSKTTFLAPGHAWLEGLRKDPDADIKGVGKALCRAALRALAAERGLKSIGFSAYGHNAATIALNEAIGFKRIGIFTVKSKRLPGDARGREPYGRPVYPQGGPAGPGLAVAPALDRSAALARLQDAGWLREFRLHEWKAYPVGPCPALEGGHALLEARDASGLTVATLAWNLDGHKRQLSILGFEAKYPEALESLFAQAERACLDAGYQYLECISPSDRDKLDALAALGYESWESEDDFLLYEWPLDRYAELSSL